MDERKAGQSAENKDGTRSAAGGDESKAIQEQLLRIAHMFNEHREDLLMRDLCRLAIKCARERLIRV